MRHPGGFLARDDPEGFAVPFLPNSGHIMQAVLVDGSDACDDRPGQKLFNLRRGELGVLAHPLWSSLVRHSVFCHCRGWIQARASSPTYCTGSNTTTGISRSVLS